MELQLHHVSLPVTELTTSKRFYGEVLGLREIARPAAFNFEGAWYQVGTGQLHLIVCEPGAPPPTFRSGKKRNSRDVHFALRVRSFREALEHLASKGYSEGAYDDFRDMRVNLNKPGEGAGFPQIYILDPDRHTVEINAERLD
jgi:catechol 2,3-dioxygenase-like lactoylglutathione lyase family enzyme